MIYTDIKRNLSLLPLNGEAGMKKILLMIALRNKLSIGLNENFCYVADDKTGEMGFDGILLANVNFDDDDDEKISFVIHPFKNFQQKEASFYELNVKTGKITLKFGSEIDFRWTEFMKFYEVLEIIGDE